MPWPKRDWQERFWEKVGTHDINGCRDWTAARFQGGYGAFRLGGKQQKAHRVMWMLHYGEIPEGMLVCHTCDRPPCVEIGHLFLGTPQSNMDDKVRKGRLVASPREKNGMWGVRKTHCKQGHPLTSDNIYMHRDQRHCAVCRKTRITAWNAARAAEKRSKRAS